MDVPSHQAPTGFLAIGIFLFFGATMASLAATTLLWPGTALDRLWVLNRKRVSYSRLSAARLGFSSCCSVWR